MEAILADRIRAGDVIVIRYEGPKGGPGMREMLSPTSALIGKGLGDSVGLITDGRFSGGTGAWWSATSPLRPTWAACWRWCIEALDHHRCRPAAAAAERARGRTGEAARRLDPA